jgi:hypothetical protein
LLAKSLRPKQLIIFGPRVFIDGAAFVRLRLDLRDDNLLFVCRRKDKMMVASVGMKQIYGQVLFVYTLHNNDTAGSLRVVKACREYLAVPGEDIFTYEF